MKKIIICDAILPIGPKLLKEAKDIELIDASKLDLAKKYELLQEASVAITRSPTAVQEEFLSHAKELKAVIRAGVGVDNIDLDACSKKGIIVMNVPTANTIAAVELTMAHLLCSARSFTNACNHLKIDRKWDREAFYGSELFGKTLGLIGFGNIGSAVASRALAFGMKILAYDPFIQSSIITQKGATAIKDLKDLLKNSDFLSIHTPKTKQTIDMISFDELALLKDGVRLINCARGGLFNEEALSYGLKTNKIAWLGIDVFDIEPSCDNILLDHPNVSASSHLGANTIESQENIAIQSCQQALLAARSISYKNALNLVVKQDELSPLIREFLDLASKLGFILASLLNEPIKSIELRASGSITSELKGLETFATVGALGSFLGPKINLLNASFIAKDKDIKISSLKEAKTGYTNKIFLRMIGEKNELSIAGTVFDDKEQRIVSVNEFETDFAPAGKMIIFKNKDIPGVIASVASLLANADINIADFRLGRDKSGFALAVILVDEAISDELLQSLNLLEACVFAKYLEI